MTHLVLLSSANAADVAIPVRLAVAGSSVSLQRSVSYRNPIRLAECAGHLKCQISPSTGDCQSP